MLDNLLNTMANDLGIPRMADKNDEQFFCCVSYSALRFWIQAFCLDDGYGGSYGVSSSAIIRKSTLWLLSLSDLYPGLIDWYQGDKGINSYFHQLLQILVDVQDLVITEERLYRCTALHKASSQAGLSLILGMADPTNQQDTLPFSGMAYAYVDPKYTEPRFVFREEKTLKTTVGTTTITRMKDSSYIAIDLTCPLSGDLHSPLLTLLTWPVSTVNDQQHRLARLPYEAALVNVLHSMGFEVKFAMS